MAAKWKDLPSLLLYEIAALLIPAEGYRLSAVCHQWHCGMAAEDSAAVIAVKPQPWLMLPRRCGKKKSWLIRTDEDQEYWKPPSVVGLDRDYSLCSAQLADDLGDNHRWIGSTGSWVLSTDDDCIIHILNPFTLDQILLPPLSALGHAYSVEKGIFFVHKVVLSSSPTLGGDFFAMGTIRSGGRRILAYTRRHSNAWFLVPKEEYLTHGCGSFEDIIFYDGTFCAVAVVGVVFQYKPSTNVFKASTLDKMSPPLQERFGTNQKRYLVKRSGDLLQVVKGKEFYGIFMLDFCSNTWTELHNLRG